jgi:hypothetical protein
LPPPAVALNPAESIESSCGDALAGMLSLEKEELRLLQKRLRLAAAPPEASSSELVLMADGLLRNERLADATSLEATGRRFLRFLSEFNKDDDDEGELDQKSLRSGFLPSKDERMLKLPNEPSDGARTRHAEDFHTTNGLHKTCRRSHLVFFGGDGRVPTWPRSRTEPRGQEEDKK